MGSPFHLVRSWLFLAVQRPPRPRSARSSCTRSLWPQVRRRLQADQIVHHAQKEIGGLGGAYGRCQDQSSRFSQTQGLYCGAGRHPGSEAVVDQDRGPPHHFRLWPLAPEVAQSAPYLRELLRRNLLDVVVGDAETPDHVLVEDAHTAGRDGPDAELWLPWRP